MSANVHPIFTPALRAIYPEPKVLSPFDAWQKDCYGNILSDSKDVPDEELEESGYELLRRLAEFQELLAESE